jgi:hypothetical protein
MIGYFVVFLKLASGFNLNFVLNPLFPLRLPHCGQATVWKDREMEQLSCAQDLKTSKEEIFS